MLRELLGISGSQPPSNRAGNRRRRHRRVGAATAVLNCGAIASAYDYHFQRFLSECFPRGTGFPDCPLPDVGQICARADVRAFSIDDAATTEIDDAFSIAGALPGVGWRVGIHIAAPGSVSCPARRSTVARGTLVLVYARQQDHDAAPMRWLSASRCRPAATARRSLCISRSRRGWITGHESRLEIVPVVANLRHHEIEPLFNASTLARSAGVCL